MKDPIARLVQCREALCKAQEEIRKLEEFRKHDAEIIGRLANGCVSHLNTIARLKKLLGDSWWMLKLHVPESIHLYTAMYEASLPEPLPGPLASSKVSEAASLAVSAPVVRDSISKKKG